jgi:hypothetical protein
MSSKLKAGNATSGAIIDADTTGILEIQTGSTPTTAITVDASQNVGIGTSSPTYKLDVSSASTTVAHFYNSAGRGLCIVDGTSDSSFRVSRAGTMVGWFQSDSSGTEVNMGTSSANPLAFYTNNTERMRIDSSGNLLVGTTSKANSGWSGGYVQSVGYAARSGAGGSFSGNAFNINWTGNANLWIDSTNIGQFSFVSDYRIKRNIETQTESGLDKVLKLRPVTYQMANYGTLFKASEDVKEGFIAHEVKEVIPSGVDGEKDAENQIQSLRVDAILAVAVKAIQELNAKVDAQAAEIAALKGVA